MAAKSKKPAKDIFISPEPAHWAEMSAIEVIDEIVNRIIDRNLQDISRSSDKV